MERTALFPGSFDPFTLGHKAVAQIGLSMFDRLVIGVGVNGGKRGLMSPERRKELIERALEADGQFAGRIEVAVYEGLTGDFCRARGIGHIIRGLRTGADLDFERAAAAANAQFFPEITTVCVLTPAGLAHVSSSLVREILVAGGDPSPLLPPLPDNMNIKDFFE
ncbi:MAG: pantetheine-phosphate adenylyltransferase [Alistipes sp.]|jgi:pantetheine-phosphate adenylyltransferase|nr:pantetheine-phosphate adenylyltransferase [Alistipes sp.]